jgi:hypothetical protein
MEGVCQRDGVVRLRVDDGADRVPVRDLTGSPSAAL